MDIEQIIEEMAARAMEGAEQEADLRDVLSGKALELWMDESGERFFIVADEQDAEILNRGRGEVLTVHEFRLIAKIADADAAREVLRFKRVLDGRLTSGQFVERCERGSDA